jgi:hypothetical protein
MASRAAAAAAQKALQLREQLWPDAEPHLWNRKAHKGFTTIPKTMPLILKIMDEMTKGAPVSATYMALWCTTWDNSLVSLAKPGELAFAAGFSGERDRHTWSTRMRKLAELEFIGIKEGRSGPMSHAIIWNPHTVIRWHHDVAKTPGLRETSWNALLELANELGVNDMLSPLPPGATSPRFVPPPPPADSPQVARKIQNSTSQSPAPAPSVWKTKPLRRAPPPDKPVRTKVGNVD